MKLVFLKSQEIAKGVFSFSFAPRQAISWIAGQSIRLELAALDYGTAERRFSISSAPYEQIVTVTTRPSSSDFKQALFALQPGTEIDAHAIEGTFVWDESVQNPLFIAAGIGITPFHAMLAQRAHDGLPLAATLIHGNRDDNPPFVRELAVLQQAHPELQIVHHTGRIQADWVATIFPDLKNRALYLSGPSRFVDELKAELTKRGVAEAAIRCDWFTGRLPAEG